MPDAPIDNPILNGPYAAPTRHWLFDDGGITNKVVDGRRPSGYFVPVPQARRQTAQLSSTLTGRSPWTQLGMI